MDYKAQLKEWKQRRDRIKKMLQRGITEAEVARQLGITRQRVNQLARRP